MGFSYNANLFSIPSKINIVLGSTRLTLPFRPITVTNCNIFSLIEHQGNPKYIGVIWGTHGLLHPIVNSHIKAIYRAAAGMCFVLQLILGKICQLAFDASTDAAPSPPTPTIIM